jgi:guanidinopropionase
MTLEQNNPGPQWPRRPADPFVEMLVPNHFGATPTVFGAPNAETPEDLARFDAAFLGIPWSAPTSYGRTGNAAGNYWGTNLTPQEFRVNSIKYSGFLPELDLDVFEHLRIADRGDAEISRDMATTLSNVEADVGQILDAGCIPITMGGNSGPGTYAVVKAVAGRADGPVAIVDFDAHHDSHQGHWQLDNPRIPRWGGTWARRVLDLDGVDPEQFYFFGLRGPRNDRETFLRFKERGVKRENIYTYREIKKVRRAGFDEWAEQIARQIAGGASKVWVHFDPDVLDVSSNTDFGDEPLGMYPEETIELLYQIGRATGREKFGGLSFVGVPFAAQSLHYILVYCIVYALAGVVQSEQ